MTSFSDAIRIECDYVLYNSLISECNTRDLTVKFYNETVTSVSGKLMDILVYEEIKSFKIEASPMLQFFPKGIEKFFPNVEKISVTQTGLKTITYNDLKNFPKLKTLILRQNQLKELEASLFELNREIEDVDLSNNKLEHLGVNFLKFAEHLNSIDVTNNICVNGSAKTPVEFKRLKMRFSENCPPSKTTVSAAKFSSSFVLLSFAVIIFALIVFNCIKFIVE